MVSVLILTVQKVCKPADFQRKGKQMPAVETFALGGETLRAPTIVAKKKIRVFLINNYREKK